MLMQSKEMLYCRGSKTVGAPPGGAVGSLGYDARVFCMRDIFILNKIWAQDKICRLLLVGILLFKI
jgi:hypothetical protein